MFVSKMRRLTKIVVFVLFYLQCINSEELLQQKTIYAYKGKILLKNVASDKLASIWTISGKLSVENLTDYITFKLDDVKTRIFNGDPGFLKSVREKNIPENAKAIQEPFLVYLGNKYGYNITHKPDEPNWSLNMKRSIANIFFLNTDKKTNSIEDEITIYGDCKVKYEIISSNNGGVTISKTIDRQFFRIPPIFYASNLYWEVTPQIFDPIQWETKRIYYFDDADSLRKIQSFTFTTYQSMPSVRSKLIIDQSQEFTRINNTTIFDPINITELTETSSIVYNFSIEDETRKELKQLNSDELIKYFSENYEEFKENFGQPILVNIDMIGNDTISNMFDALFLMNKDTLLHLGKMITKRDDTFMQHLFVSYLPYLGTNDSLDYIKELFAQDEVLNDWLSVKILATLPGYLLDVNEEIVKKMEDIMNLKNNVNNQVKYAGIISFASIVSAANEKNVLNMETLTKYVGIYSKNFKDAENYETKMVWLLGLINMANTLSNEDIFAFICNSNESRHIRVLAAYGFKEYINTHSEMYGNMWPIVKNTSEPLEVRVACLDLLLYSQITKIQFESIVKWYKEELQGPSEQHLANYMYTTLKTLQNTNGNFEHLSYAAEMLKQIKPHKLNKVSSTGNYRMAYTDSNVNFGASLQTRFISNPITNVLNTAFVTVDSFAHSLNFGRYSVYVKVEGIPEYLFSLFVFDNDEKYTLPKILELVQKNAYIFKQTDNNIHVDVVIFCQDRVVFCAHINKNTIENYATNPMYTELLNLINDYTSLSLSAYEYNYLISDLGTILTVSTGIVEIASYELEGLNKMLNVSSLSSSASDSSEEEDDLTDLTSNYRSNSYYSLSTASYNPLLDASITTFKYITEKKRIHLPCAFNFTTLSFKWKHKKDALNLVGDHLIGTMIDKEQVLREYCVNCKRVSLINKDDDWETELMGENIFWHVIGDTLNVTQTKLSAEQIALNSMEPKRRKSTLFDLIDHNQKITLDNIEKIFLLVNHYVTYNRYISNDLYRYSVRSLPFPNGEASETTFKVMFDTRDISSDENPITDNINISIALTTRKQNDVDAIILSHGNINYRYFLASEANCSRIHQKYNIVLAMYSSGTVTPIKVCINRDVQYPSRRVNKFSLDAVDGTKAKTTLLYGSVEDTTAGCPTQDQFYVTEIYSASDEQKAMLLASNEYKKCMEQSKDLKYTPPTDDCLIAHEIISKYESCDIYADNIPHPKDNSIVRTEHGIHVIRYTQMNDVHVKKSSINENLIEKSNVLHKAIDTLDFQPLMTLNPRVVAYDDQDLEWGIASACYITPNSIRTFTGHTIKNYAEKSVDDAVAFVECSNKTTAALTIQKYGDKYIGFQLYSYNDTFVVSVPNADGKIKIEFNNEIMTKTNKYERLKLRFLDDDVIYFSLDIADIYFSAEYLSIKINSVYNNFICGLCADINNH